MADHYVQDPNDKLDWTHDWSDFLAAGDTISSRVWSIDPDQSPSHIVSGGTSATAWVDNLNVGVVYRLSEKIITANGVEGERAITIRCGEK